jgi:hypothetical protein
MSKKYERGEAGDQSSATDEQRVTWERQQAEWAAWASDAWAEAKHLLGSDDHLRREVEVRWRAQWLAKRRATPDPLAPADDVPPISTEAANSAFHKLAERREIILAIVERDSFGGGLRGLSQVENARHWLQSEPGRPTLATIARSATADGKPILSVRPAPAIKAQAKADPRPPVSDAERERRAADAAAWMVGER